jgi:hypothetical protein
MAARALVAYSSSSTHVQTTIDYLLGFQRHSGFSTSFVHVTHDAKIDFDLSRFDLVFHNYCSRFCFQGYVSEDYQKKLRAFRGLKILAVQDEYDRTDTLKAAIKDMGFHIVLTCVPQDSLEYVYPKSKFPGVTFITVFTGYVTDDFDNGQNPPPPLKDRPIVVGYRGRDIGGRYGRLGFDKFEIGRRMKEICDKRGVVNDIAMDEASRIYGTAWFDYLGRCRSMLGSESGSNVFDFDGSIETLYKKMMAENGGVPPSYESMLPIVAERDNAIKMGQISPRVFECAITRTPMVLFRGRYSDAIQPDEHYIALEKDFSNVEDVLRRLEDIPALEAMTERAYAHLVGSGRFSYRTFFGMIAEVAIKRMKRLRAAIPEPIEPADSGLVVHNWFGYEQPSKYPEKPEMFRMRLSFAEIRLLRGEDERLTAGFVEHRANLVTNLENQAATLRGIQHDLNENTDGVPQQVDTAPVFPAITRFLARSDSEDSTWVARWRNLSAQVDDAVARNDSSALAVAVDAALTGIRDRYRVLGEKYGQFGTLYEQEMKRTADLIIQTQKGVVQIVSKQVLASPRGFTFIVPAIRQTARLAGLWITSITQKAAVMFGHGIRHPVLQRLSAGLGHRIPWAARLYQRLATFIRARIGI